MDQIIEKLRPVLWRSKRPTQPLTTEVQKNILRLCKGSVLKMLHLLKKKHCQNGLADFQKPFKFH